MNLSSDHHAVYLNVEGRLCIAHSSLCRNEVIVLLHRGNFQIVGRQGIQKTWQRLLPSEQTALCTAPKLGSADNSGVLVVHFSNRSIQRRLVVLI